MLVMEFEFKFECCRNPTIFPHQNPTDVERQCLAEFKFGFCINKSKLFSLPVVQKSTKW